MEFSWKFLIKKKSKEDEFSEEEIIEEYEKIIEEKIANKFSKNILKSMREDDVIDFKWIIRGS